MSEAASPAVAVLAAAVQSYAPHLQPEGEMTDPVFGAPTQYGTPYHAYCHAVLARRGPPGRRAGHLSAAARGLHAALCHLENLREPGTLASFRRETGAAAAANHRDFFWPPVLRTHALLRELGHPDAAKFARRIADIPVPSAFAARPPSNWAMVWLCGEWLRLRAGLSPTPAATFDDWLGAYFTGPLLVEQGLYQEPGHPNSYDLFTRLHLAEVLAEGYVGRWLPAMERLMDTGLARSLAVQLSDGSLASAHRSTGQTWTLGAQVAYFTLAERFWQGRDPARAEAARAATLRAFSAFCRWQRFGGPYSPVENRLPPAWRVGYEPYTADGHYGNLALGFLAGAVVRGFRGEGALSGRAAGAHLEWDPTRRALCHAGVYSAQFNAWPAEHYDGFGFTDITFGPGRYLHFASSVHHLSRPTAFHNPGLALRAGPGPGEIQPLAQEPLSPLAPFERGAGEAEFRLHSRVQGGAHTHRVVCAASVAGISVDESTPGRQGPLTFLLPYPRDCGTGTTTAVRLERSGHGVAVSLRLGAEAVRVEVEAPLQQAIDLPHGFENRRGLCGLLRLDLAGEREGLRYRFALER